MILKHNDFESLLDFQFSERTRNIIDSFQIELLPLSQKQYKKEIESISEILNNPVITKSGEHRINDWNYGWNENNLEFKDTKLLNSLIPKYFGKYKVLRFNNQFYKAISNNCELNMLRTLQFYVCEKYCKDIENIYEFGCGTGHNLFAISEFIENKDINSYKNYEELTKVVLDAEERISKKSLTGQYDKLYEDNEYLMVRPLTVEASCKFGVDTKWCIAAKVENRFLQYTERGQNEFFFVIKKGAEIGRAHV